MTLDWNTNKDENNLHPSYLKESHFSFPVKIIHSYNTGHIYVRPVSNLKPFTNEEEGIIIETLSKLGIGVVRNTVKSNFTTVPIKIGFGFRIF